MLEISDVAIDRAHLKSAKKNVFFNQKVAEYYERLMKDPFHSDIMLRIDRKLEKLESCNRFWELDVYRQGEVKEFLSTILCGDKFCNNCKKVKQAHRMKQFNGHIMKSAKDHSLSQLVLTVPNCSGEELSDTIKRIFKAFTRLITYFKESKKIKGLDFRKLIGYRGAIRSLEITYQGDEYHPHLHVLIAHKRSTGKKKNVNKYSFDKYKNKDIRKFTDFEILIQKIWRLLIDGVKVTKENIEELDIGYSCTMDKFQENDFIELFKYMTKAVTEEEGKIMTYENFKELYFTLNRVRQIQGYGIYYNVKDTEITEDVFEETMTEYDELIESLRQKENPVRVDQTLAELVKEDNYTVISRKRIGHYIRIINQNEMKANKKR
jgi:hypothetical protein